MADSPRKAAAADETAGTPRWVKVAGIVVLVLVVVFVVLKLTGLGGSHGPGRHAPGADAPRGHTGPPSGVTHSEP
jgi:hypothetical protein